MAVSRLHSALKVTTQEQSDLSADKTVVFPTQDRRPAELHPWTSWGLWTLYASLRILVAQACPLLRAPVHHGRAPISKPAWPSNPSALAKYKA